MPHNFEFLEGIGTYHRPAASEIAQETFGGEKRACTMKRRMNAERIAWIFGTLIVCGILIFSVSAGKSLGNTIRSIRPPAIRIRDTVCEYVSENRERIISEFEMMQSWKEKYIRIYEMDGKILGVRNNPLYNRTEIEEKEITGFVNGENITDRVYPSGGNTDMEIIFERDNVIAVKGFSVGNAVYATYHGYYYSPNDVPLWVCADEPRSYSDSLGEYLYHPLKQDGEMWRADIAGIEEAQYESFVDDYCTMRICENLYYYCYGW